MTFYNYSRVLQTIFLFWSPRKKSLKSMELKDNETFLGNITSQSNSSQYNPGTNDAYTNSYMTCERSLEYLHYAWIIYFPILFTFGLVGNTLTLIVLSKEKRQNSKNVYLSALTSADIIFLVLSLPFYLDQFKVINDSPTFNRFITSYQAIGLMVINTCIAASRGIIICFSVERFIAVRYPLHAKYFCKKITAIKITLAVFLISLSYTIYPLVAYIWAIENDSLPLLNVRLKHPQWLQTYEEFTHWIWIIMLCGTFFVLFVLNGILIKELRKRRRTLKKLIGFESHKMFHENATTIILIATATVFLITQFPVLLNTILGIVGMWRTPVFPRSCRLAMIMVGDLFVLTNASLNCLLYIGVSRTFRKTLKDLCYCKPQSIPSISEGNMSSVEMFYLNTMELGLYPVQKQTPALTPDVNKNLRKSNRIKINSQPKIIQNYNGELKHDEKVSAEDVKLICEDKTNLSEYLFILKNHSVTTDCIYGSQDVRQAMSAAPLNIKEQSC